MKNIILALIILFLSVSIAKAVERINDNCYRFDGVLVCEAEKVTRTEIVKVIPPAIEPIKNEEVIVKTFWTYGNETEK